MKLRVTRLWLVTTVAALWTSVGAEILFNNATKAGLAGEGLRTRARPQGGDYSEVQDGNIVAAWSFRQWTFRLADDFTVPSDGWLVREFTTYGEQPDTNSVSVNQGAMEICRDRWDGPVVAEGVFYRAEMTDIYRIFFNDPTREFQLQKVTYRLNVKLSPGNYWARWSANGNMAISGPWGPALTKVGALTVPGANAMQRQVTTQIQWVPVKDFGSLALQDLPFMITGHKLPTQIGSGLEVRPLVPDPLAPLLAACPLDMDKTRATPSERGL